MKKTTSDLFVAPYILWILLFVLAPVAMIVWQSFFNIEGHFTLENYKTYFASQNLTYLKMSLNSVLYAGIITIVTLVISYPTALVDAHYFTDLGEFVAQSLRFYRDFWTKWFSQSVFKFYRDWFSANFVHRLFFYFCC